MFATQTRGYDGTPRTLALISASDTRISGTSEVNRTLPHRSGLGLLLRAAQGRTDVAAATGTWLLLDQCEEANVVKSRHSKPAQVADGRCGLNKTLNFFEHPHDHARSLLCNVSAKETP